jgi:hypothetical protein
MPCLHAAYGAKVPHLGLRYWGGRILEMFTKLSATQKFDKEKRTDIEASLAAKTAASHRYDIA